MTLEDVAEELAHDFTNAHGLACTLVESGVGCVGLGIGRHTDGGSILTEECFFVDKVDVLLRNGTYEEPLTTRGDAREVAVETVEHLQAFLLGCLVVIGIRVNLNEEVITVVIRFAEGEDDVKFVGMCIDDLLGKASVVVAEEEAAIPHCTTFGHVAIGEVEGRLIEFQSLTLLLVVRNKVLAHLVETDYTRAVDALPEMLATTRKGLALGKGTIDKHLDAVALGWSG